MVWINFAPDTNLTKLASQVELQLDEITQRKQIVPQWFAGGTLDNSQDFI